MSDLSVFSFSFSGRSYVARVSAGPNKAARDRRAVSFALVGREPVLGTVLVQREDGAWWSPWRGERALTALQRAAIAAVPA